MTLERKSGYYCEYIYFTVAAAVAADSAARLTKVNMLDSVNQASVETH